MSQGVRQLHKKVLIFLLFILTQLLELRLFRVEVASRQLGVTELGATAVECFGITPAHAAIAPIRIRRRAAILIRHTLLLPAAGGTPRAVELFLPDRLLLCSTKIVGFHVAHRLF